MATPSTAYDGSVYESSPARHLRLVSRADVPYLERIPASDAHVKPSEKAAGWPMALLVLALMAYFLSVPLAIWWALS